MRRGRWRGQHDETLRILQQVRESNDHLARRQGHAIEAAECRFKRGDGSLHACCRECCPHRG